MSGNDREEPGERAARLREVGDQYLTTIVGALRREYPNQLRHPMTGPGDTPTPREIHPAFYGCYDWHSAVEMHWALVRLLRAVPDIAGRDGARAVLREHLTAPAMDAEARYLREHPGFERPYGWGWALTLADELATWDDPDAVTWARNVRPLAAAVEDLILGWLPRATYPVRDGAHLNSAFGLARALPYARATASASGGALRDAIEAAARRWYSADTDYPARYEPGGADFLSPSLTEAELMSGVLEPAEFTGWLDRFLPGLVTGEPATLFTPAVVSDATDGQIAHLHGLNLYRAYGFRRLATALPGGDPRRPVLDAATRRHADAALPAVCGGHYMVEHWLAAYAILLLA